MSSKKIIYFYHHYFIGGLVALNCRTVCKEWNSYLQSSDIWHKLLRQEAIKAQNFASKARQLMSAAYSESLVMDGGVDISNTWIWKFNAFVIQNLEIGAFKSRDFYPESGNSKSIYSTIKHLSQRLELAKKIEMFPNDWEAHSLSAHEFMLHEEIQLKKVIKRCRNRAGLVCNPNGEKMHEAMLKISNVRGLSSETFYQVS